MALSVIDLIPFHQTIDNDFGRNAVFIPTGYHSELNLSVKPTFVVPYCKTRNDARDLRQLSQTTQLDEQHILSLNLSRLSNLDTFELSCKRDRQIKTEPVQSKFSNFMTLSGLIEAKS